MARTIIGVNDAKAVKRYAGLLAYDESQKSYFNQRFIGRGAGRKPDQLLTDLESDAGEMISYDLLAELKMAPIEGENNLENNEEQQKFFTDTIYIDQARCGVNTGGRDPQTHPAQPAGKARRQQSSWWARLKDEIRFIYLSGARSVNLNFLVPTTWTSRANNALVSPDSNHLLYGGNATAKNNMTNEASGVAGSDTFDLRLIDRAKTKADNQGNGATGIPVLQPCKSSTATSVLCASCIFPGGRPAQQHKHGAMVDIQKAARNRRRTQFAAVQGFVLACTGCHPALASQRDPIQSTTALAPTTRQPAHCSWGAGAC